MSFVLTIVLPTGRQEFEIDWVEINTPSGNRVVQEGHAPLIAPLEPKSNFKFSKPNGTIESFAVDSGIARIDRKGITIIATQL
ncbi:TPA: hypothetical protein DDZ86_00950 [Candidatus Dependentiae bacterium]|nr:MAG: hypothetical protein UW09_C0004G0072 [candidate division TM6 bacterium GW2011_GWF2_43_87]HBL98193.1 hypothetical protein [Candidatus Dependentiae bacterium]